MDFLVLDIEPIAFHLGPFPVRWYGLAYLAGFLLGWRYCLYLVSVLSDVRPHKQDIDDLISWIIIAVILGGRLGYVLFYNASHYMHNPVDIVKIWEGGMSFHGGVIGVLIAMFFYARRRQIEIMRLSDVVCAAAPIGLFFGRIANFVNAELYGRVTSAPWGVVFPSVGDEPRHPSQIYEAILEGALLFVALLYLYKKYAHRPGIVSGAFLIGYGVFRGFVEFYREPDAQIGLIYGFVSMGQVLCLPMIAGGFLLLLLVSKRGSRIKEHP